MYTNETDEYAFLSQCRNISALSQHYIYTKDYEVETHRCNKLLDNVKKTTQAFSKSYIFNGI